MQQLVVNPCASGAVRQSDGGCKCIPSELRAVNLRMHKVECMEGFSMPILSSDELQLRLGPRVTGFTEMPAETCVSRRLSHTSRQVPSCKFMHLEATSGLPHDTGNSFLFTYIFRSLQYYSNNTCPRPVFRLDDTDNGRRYVHRAVYLEKIHP